MKLDFDDEKTAVIFIDTQSESVILSISDSIDAYDQILTDAYIQKISNFLDDSKKWVGICLKLLEHDKTAGRHHEVTGVYVLSEQFEESLIFGIQFRVSGDIEHGRGLKINGNTFQILDYGLGEVAFIQ